MSEVPVKDQDGEEIGSVVRYVMGPDGVLNLVLDVYWPPGATEKRRLTGRVPVVFGDIIESERARSERSGE